MLTNVTYKFIFVNIKGNEMAKEEARLVDSIDEMKSFFEMYNIGKISIENENQRLRDQFAAASLSGILSADRDLININEYASDAFNIADAMMAERAKRYGND